MEGWWTCEMTAKFRYTYRIKKDVIYSSSVELALPIILISLVSPGIKIFFAATMIIALIFIVIVPMIIRAKLKPGLEITPDKLIIRSPFHSEEFDVEQIQTISFTKITRKKSLITLKVDPQYLRKQRGSIRYLMTKRFGSPFDVIVPDIYNSPPKDIFDCLSREFSHLVQPK